MERCYDEEEKLKFVRGFKKCNLTLLEYCDKMQIRYDDMKIWLKKYNNPPAFGKIDVKALSSNTSPIKFETDTITIELKPGYDKQLLQQLVEVLTLC